MTQISFNERTQTKKGTVGERIVDEYLKNAGWVVYSAAENSGAHAFDRLAVKNKQKLMIAEVKSKARMNNYSATGIDRRHFMEYSDIVLKYHLEVWLFFVDEHPEVMAVYGNSLFNLIDESTGKDGRTYPLFMNNWKKPIVLFDIAKMITLRKLTEGERKELTALSTRNHGYLSKEL